MKSRFKALDEHLRDENAERVERIRTRERGVCVAPVAPSPADVLAEWEARRPKYPAWRASVPDGRFRVRYHYVCDRPGMRYVHQAETPADLVRWMRDYLSESADVVEIWEAA